MPLNHGDAERGLWELLADSPKVSEFQNAGQANLHLFLTDALPGGQRCVRARVEDDIIEARCREDTPVKKMDLQVSPGEKAGIALTSISVHSNGDLGPIVVGFVSPGSVAACDGRLGRGDQVLEINGHSLKLASLAKAQWLLDSATSKGTISLATLPFAFLKGIKQSISRCNHRITPTSALKHKYSHSPTSAFVPSPQLVVSRLEPSPFAPSELSSAPDKPQPSALTPSELSSAPDKSQPSALTPSELSSAPDKPQPSAPTPSGLSSAPDKPQPSPLTPSELSSAPSNVDKLQTSKLPDNTIPLAIELELLKSNSTASPSTLPPTHEATHTIEADQSTSPNGLVVSDVRQETGLFEISIFKSMFGLGVQLVSDEMGIVAVKKIASWSAMAKDGNIRVGDHIIAVNDTIFIDKPLSECDSFLNELPRGQVTFLVMAPPKHNLPVAPIYTGIARSHCGKQLIAEQQVVKTQLLCRCNEPIGIEIEGGLDTTLLYVYISHLTPGSPAFESGVFRKGDQLLLLGGECVMGLTHKEALNLIKNASKIPNTVEVVAQRKESTKQTQSLMLPVDTRITTTIVTTPQGHPQPTRAPSCSNKRPLKRILVPEVIFTVQLLRTAGEKLGLRIIGGADNPNLAAVHVKEVVRGYLAHKDGHLRRGDRIVSVNGHSLEGLTRNEAMAVLRESELDVTLVIVRKIGRRSSQTLTHSSKAAPAKLCSDVKEIDTIAESTTTLSNRPEHCTSSNITEERIMIDLHREADEKFGLGIAGGANIPHLQEAHIMLLVEDSVACKDDRLKKGDRIISINQCILAGLTHNEVVAILKEAGQDISLVIGRKDNSATKAANRTLSSSELRK